MKQIAQRLRDGRVELVDVPDPRPGPGEVAVRVEASVLSAGTERATLDVARKNLLGKARARPEQARQVIAKARRDGITDTVQLVRRRLEELSPLGYSAAGTVREVGAEVRGLRPGQRVAIAGGGYATHAEVDVVPQLLCASVPEAVSVERAAFATVGAIALHGFRRAELQIGSTVAIIGLGLIGQLATRIAVAAGCRVVGTDLDPRLCELGSEAGADALLRGELGSRWDGSADAVLICASAPADNDPIRLASALARDRAPVVVVGDVALELPRGPFYMGELDLRLSRSYGPGRYDPGYEEHGHDYPIGYVRWTEQRNMESFLRLIAEGRLDPVELITHRFVIGEAERAFELLAGGGGAEERALGIVLEYPGEVPPADEKGVEVQEAPVAAAAAGWRPRSREGAPRFGIIGAGGFATATIIPGLAAAGLSPGAVASAGGLSAEDSRRRFGFQRAYADPAELIAHPDLDLIVIATRHDSHAELAAASLAAGIPTYVEKPLSLDFDGLRTIRGAQRASGAPLWVGFNRRHAPLAAELRGALSSPRLMRYRVNAGRLPLSHWTNDPRVGGGRLLGEGCHFIDFLCDQADSDPVRVQASGFASTPGLALVATDNFSVRIEFADGSVGTVDFAADAPSGPGKERFEASAPGAYAVIDDFRSAEIWTDQGDAGGRPRRLGGRRQQKGWTEQFTEIGAVLRGEREAPEPDSFLISSLTTLLAAHSLGTAGGESVVVSAGEVAERP